MVRIIERHAVAVSQLAGGVEEAVRAPAAGGRLLDDTVRVDPGPIVAVSGSVRCRVPAMVYAIVPKRLESDAEGSAATF